MNRLATVLLVVMQASCANRLQVTETPDPEFLNVLGSPAAFDGEAVKVRGWISLRPEDNNVWLTWGDHEDWEVSHCLSIVNYYLLDDAVRSLDGRYVEITGTFRMDASNRGTMIRLGACSNLAIELKSPEAVVRILD